MRKLVVLILVVLGLLLLVPAAASASAPTLNSLAKSLKALQKLAEHRHHSGLHDGRLAERGRRRRLARPAEVRRRHNRQPRPRTLPAAPL